MEKKNAWEKYPEGTKRQDVFTFAEEYRKFISSCKTERECAGEFYRKAKEAGVRVYGMSQYRIETTEEPATILLGYANMSEEDIKEAVNLLNQCWTEL